MKLIKCFNSYNEIQVELVNLMNSKNIRFGMLGDLLGYKTYMMYVKFKNNKLTQEQYDIILKAAREMSVQPTQYELVQHNQKLLGVERRAKKFKEEYLVGVSKEVQDLIIQEFFVDEIVAYKMIHAKTVSDVLKIRFDVYGS